MQQILDRTQESLAQAFASLARNARRQQHLYYATVGLLIAIVMVSAILLGGLAAARHLDNRRSHVAQYVGAISLQLQSEASFLRRTALTVGYYLRARSDSPPNPELLEQVRRTGVATAPDGRYMLLVPAATRRAWGTALPERVWQLQQIATAALTTQLAFEVDHLAYVVDANAEFAVLLAPSQITHGAVPALQPDLVTTLRDNLVRELQARNGRPFPDGSEQIWVGPTEDPVAHSRVMTAVTAIPTSDEHQTILVASSIPVSAFLAQLKRPSEPATLLLINGAENRIDVSPAGPPADAARILARARHMPPDTLRLTGSGLLLVQPLRPGFGSLVYFLPYSTLLVSIANELIAIGAVGLLLIAAIVLTARYWDIHLLRRSHAEAARALENETINHILVSATPIGLCIVRQQDHVILTSNQIANSLIGRGQMATLPTHIIDALRQHSPGTSTHQVGSIAQIIVPAHAPASGAGQSSSGIGATAAPEQKFLQVTFAPARYRAEDVLFCAIQDVTAQQQLEQQLRAAQQASEAMMRARSNFFASMSHEIRTPLNALLGNLELLGRTEGLEAHASRLRALQVASEGLRRIVNDILDFSKIDAGEMKLVSEPFNPIGDFESLSLSYAPMVADRPIRFYVHLSPTLDTVVIGDRTRLAQIVNNLLSNAFKFTSCGKIMLSAELTRDTQERTTLVCRVRDSGIGMPPALVARIFHPFVQGEASTSARFGGTGLGLSICARLSELMGGHITVESVEGVGSAFTVAIPLGDPDTPRPAPKPMAYGSSAMVLCQETESGATLEAWLESAGWRPHALHTIGAALAWLRSNRPHILAVTGDYGLDTIRQLRGIRPVNVVWITRDGPDHPIRRASGVFEVSAYSHTAILAGALAALNEEPDASQPAGDTVNEKAPPQDGADSRPPSPQGTILVAEDNPLNQTLIAEQLETLGWEPIVVADGRQALAVLENSDIDLVLTDIHMPVMDGYELLAAIKAMNPTLPVLAFSAVTQTGQAADWHARGFSGHVAKPASLNDLKHALKAVSRPLAADASVPSGAAADSQGTTMPTAERERYQALLHKHLQTDEPELASILVRRDTAALRHWAHRSAGAFLIVGASDIVGLCRTIEHHCEASSEWSPGLNAEAVALHAAVREYGNIAVTSIARDG